MSLPPGQPNHGRAHSNGAHGIAACLNESLTLDIHRSNGFRVLELHSDAAPRDINRRKQTLERAIAHGVERPPGTGRYFPIDPEPDEFAVRDASQRLADPERRLVDEIFWYWPENPGQAEEDAALQRLAEGRDKEAEGVWLERESNGCEHRVSTHNLALLYHFRAWEREHSFLESGENGEQLSGVTKIWEKSFRRWRELSDVDVFWERLDTRIQEIDDPRLPSGTAGHIRAALPMAVLALSVGLAAKAAETGKSRSAQRIMESVRQSGFSQACIDGAVRTAVDPLRNRIKTICKTAQMGAESNPLQGDQLARQALSDAKPVLEAMDTILGEDDPTNVLCHDEIAEMALDCQLSFANKTRNWTKSLALLREAEPIASSESCRRKLRENIKDVRDNEERNDDFCGDGYYDLPAPLVAVLESARQQNKNNEHEAALAALRPLLSGQLSAPEASLMLNSDQMALVRKATAYCLGCSAVRRINRAVSELNAQETSVIKQIRSKASSFGDAVLTCAQMETIPPGVDCPCMSCGTYITGRYTILKWTFSGADEEVTLVICGWCADQHRKERAAQRSSVASSVVKGAEEYVEAAQLDPRNNFVKERIPGTRELCAAVDVPFPEAKPAAKRRAPTQSATASAKPRPRTPAPKPASTTSPTAPQKKSGCFIATAAFGSPLASEVQCLREFRDEVLRASAAGRGFIRLYEATSPPAAQWISGRNRARKAARCLLWPVVWALRLARGKLRHSSRHK